MSRAAQQIPAWFGQRLRRERERRGWTLRDLASKCGLDYSQHTIMRIENGQDARLSTAIAISSALGLSLGTLLAEPSCVACDGLPPAGFVCKKCGREEAG